MSEALLERLAAALARGERVDWERELASVSSGDERDAIEQLRVFHTISAWHAEQMTREDAHSTVGVPPPDSLPVLDRWGHLDLLEEIGRGASGTVYRAWDRRLARDVALKLLTRRDTDGEALHEARLLANVRHPSVVTVFGADVIGERVGIWMELVEGRSLERILTVDGPFSPREALSVAQDVCGALAAVHAAGLLHRDVKAQNVVRERGGRIVLMDFGSSHRHTPKDEEESPQLSGTPLYMAPELFLGQPPTPQSDLYSVGVLLFRLVSGAFPISADCVEDVRRAHRDGTRRHVRDVRPDVPVAVVEIIERALDSLPARRFDSAGGMEQALAAAVRNLAAVKEAPHPSNGRTRPFARAGLPFLISVVMLTAVTTAALVLLVEHGPQALWNRSFRSPPQSATPTTASGAKSNDAPAAGMSQEQRDLVAGFEELAGTLAADGDWDRAAGVYDQIRAVHRGSIGEFAPVSGLNIARTAFARHRAHHYDAARYLYEEALVKLETALGPAHPYVATTMGALAMLHYESGRPHEARNWLHRALRMRRALVGAVAGGTDTLPMLTFPDSARLTGQQLTSDADGDGLLPLVELGLGLDPTRVDTDGDGTGDGDESAPHTQLTNCRLYCLAVDPTKVIAHHGSVDPLRLGFFAHHTIHGTAVQRGPLAVWNVRTGPLGYYFQRLTAAQKRAAVESGWRLMLRGRVIRKLAYAFVDLTPRSARWDINLLLQPEEKTIAHLTTSLIPVEGAELSLEYPERYPLLELVWSPATRTVSYYVNGNLTAHNHPGTRQFQDDRGLSFGAGTRSDQDAGGEGEFALVWFEIR